MTWPRSVAGRVLNFASAFCQVWPRSFMTPPAHQVVQTLTVIGFWRHTAFSLESPPPTDALHALSTSVLAVALSRNPRRVAGAASNGPGLVRPGTGDGLMLSRCMVLARLLVHVGELHCCLELCPWLQHAAYLLQCRHCAPCGCRHVALHQRLEPWYVAVCDGLDHLPVFNLKTLKR